MCTCSLNINPFDEEFVNSIYISKAIHSHRCVNISVKSNGKLCCLFHPTPKRGFMWPETSVNKIVTKWTLPWRREKDDLLHVCNVISTHRVNSHSHSLICFPMGGWMNIIATRHIVCRFELIFMFRLNRIDKICEWEGMFTNISGRKVEGDIVHSIAFSLLTLPRNFL